MATKIPKWENKFWSYLRQSDGTVCPIYKCCQYRLYGQRCICDSEEFLARERRFIDNDSFDYGTSNIEVPEFYECLTKGEVFKLGIRLADKYRDEIGYNNNHITNVFNIKSCDDIHIEVRYVPLKAYCGAVWQLSDCWIIYLNSNSNPARQKFTLFHEIFHILAHYHATPKFKKSSGREGSFNELLADHFAAVTLMPEDLLRERWEEVKDVSQMATFLRVPEAIVYRALQLLRLINVY
jgi:Zn-dependent peptidase ImmA (M78 family)